ncbi:hypothetical protein [Brevundimonas sp.]|uniref:hypothetical protein n=1 Tax=Brevundimonas sp. TaxID=1871086 RepID=UPI002D529FD4|nr:hypothetical protein [Brevundimonas sp.]HYC98496.1 hypothetical protein [Brevundimonas sp.]
METAARRIDHELASLFPPHWANETSATEWLWPWGPDAPADPSPTVLMGDGTARIVLTAAPTPGGSWVRPEPEGVVLHLSARDAASIKGREVVFALWVAPPVLPTVDNFAAFAAYVAALPDPYVEPAVNADAYGLFVVSDWAATPHAGTA